MISCSILIRDTSPFLFVQIAEQLNLTVLTTLISQVALATENCYWDQQANIKYTRCVDITSQPSLLEDTFSSSLVIPCHNYGFIFKHRFIL